MRTHDRTARSPSRPHLVDRGGNGPAALSWPIIITLLSACQALGFDVPAARPPAWTYQGQLLAALDEEIRHFAAIERNATEPQRVVIRASLHYRVLITELLAHHRIDADGTAGDPRAALTGLTLAHGRAAVDQLFIAVLRRSSQAELTPGEDATRADFGRLGAFNDRAVEHAADVAASDPAARRAAFAAVLQPLADLAGLHRPPEPMAGERIEPGDQSDDELSRAIDDLDAALAALPLPERTRPVVAQLLRFLRRGARYPDLRPLVRRQLDDLDRLRAVARAVTSADWIDDELEDEYLRRAHHAITLYLDPDTREDGMRLLTRLDHRRAVISTLTVLRDHEIAIEAIVSAMRADRSPPDQRPPPDAFKLLAQGLDCVRRFAELESHVHRPEIRDLTARLLRAGRIEQQNVLARLPDVITDPQAAADPAVTALVTRFARTVDELALLAAASSWIDVAAGAGRGLRPAFVRRLQSTAAALGDPAARDEARRTLQALDHDMHRYARMDFEPDLERQTPRAVVLTGGRQRELRRRIVSARAAWIRAWSRGDVPHALRDELDAFYELTHTMHACVNLVDLVEAPTAINRCAAVECSPILLARLVNDTISRLKLATIAAIEADHDDLSSHLARLARDAPLAALIARLVDDLPSAARDDPDGAASTLHQLLHPAAACTALLPHRRELAELCLLANDAEEARAQGLDADARRFTTEVNTRARRVLNALAPAPSH